MTSVSNRREEVLDAGNQLDLPPACLFIPQVADISSLHGKARAGSTYYSYLSVNKP
jgi:hypothetical protein